MTRVHLDSSLNGLTARTLRQTLPAEIPQATISFDNLKNSEVVMMSGDQWRLEQIHDYDRLFFALTEPGREPKWQPSNLKIATISSILPLFAASCAEASELPVRPQATVGALTVLVIDDSSLDIEAAWAQLGGRYRLRVATTYVQALRAIKEGGIDVVLSDLMLPASARMMEEKGAEYIGQSTLYGLILGTKAAKQGVKKVAVVTSASDRDHPMVKVLLGDLMSFPCGESEVRFFESGGETRPKDWQHVIDMLQNAS